MQKKNTGGIYLKSLDLRKYIKEKKEAASPEMWRQIIKITWPAFIELVMSTLFGMVDMMMVGQLGPAAIASIGLTNQPFMLLIAVFAAVNVGTTTMVAWNIGAKKIDKARAIVRQTLIINGALGVITAVLGIISAKYIVTFMGANEETITDAVKYFQIIAGGLVFQGMVMGITASLRGAGETKIPMLYNVGSNLLNVFGNYVLIYGKFGFPKWGVAGAAASTSIARFISLIAGLYVIYLYKNTKIHLSLKEKYKFDINIAKKIFSIGLPSAAEQFVIQGGLTLFAKTVAGLGTAAYAAHQIGLNISGLTFAPSMAFGVAATTLVGQSLGAGDEKKANKYADVVHHMAIGIACVMGLMFIMFSHPMAKLYTNDLAVAAMAGTVLKILALAQPGQSTQLSLAGALRGAGDTMYPLYASFIGIWVFRVTVAYVFVSIFNWGLNGAWIALLLDQYTRSAVIYYRYRSGKWKTVRIKASSKGASMN
jgi:putative MATE family efflux protein